ncbi:hypothetical protein FNF28_06936 [Cafeteria roenbergensis]|uniref:histidine kinase n=1 Tax=Cafeteria roenbergensis TaxID=33653 RepID=A0A5A8CNZ5_CAFRO|nr:hypothetical protein FNF28_06936 [Cafeteria roenbergensis]
MVALVASGIDTRGCDEWRAVQAAAPAGSTWPDGLDLSGSQALRDRVVSVGTLGAVIALCILAFAFIPSVSMVLELQSSVAHVRSEQSRMQSDALVRAVTYVPSMADGDFSSVPSSGSCTPTLSSSSIMRDLQIALESSKQELDDLLLWQRLSAKDSSSLMSWGAIADSWAARLSWAERPPSGPAAPSPSPSCFGVGSAGSGASEATHDAPGAAFPWAVYTDHARVMQAAVAMVAIGTYAAATRSSRSRPGHVCVSVSVSTGRRALSGLGWSQQSAPRRGMRGSERGVLCVEVRFTGQGYSAAELDGDPFDPFGRLRHGDESLRLGSSGLRLAVVRGVASSLEGEAGLASGGEDRGAHLWLRVPVTVVRRSSESWAEHLRRSEGRGAVSPRATMASRSGAIATSVSALVRSVPASPSSPAAEPRRSASNSMGQRRRSSAAVLSARSPTNRANAPLSGWRVWVADDDPTTARVSALVVRRSGAATRTFADGAQLVAAVEAALDAGEAELEAGGGPPGTSGAETGAVWGLPDGVLVDGSMPVLGGVDAIRAIVALGKARAPWWEPRLWLVTGDVTAEAEAEALRAGADGMLRKPVTGAQLVDALLGVADSDSDQ